MTFNQLLGDLEWRLQEKGLAGIKEVTVLRAFANAAAGSGVTLTGSTFGALDLAAAADVAQAANGVTSITPGAGLRDPGFGRDQQRVANGTTAPQVAPGAGFRR